MPQSGRLTWLDTARGTAMLFVCLAHFSSTWADLEPRGLDPSAYFSPYFVLPAQRDLESRADPLVMWTDQEGTVRHELRGSPQFGSAVDEAYTC